MVACNMNLIPPYSKYMQVLALRCSSTGPSHHSARGQTMAGEFSLILQMVLVAKERDEGSPLPA